MTKRKKQTTVENKFDNDKFSNLPKRIKITAKNNDQKLVLKSLKENDINFLYGPPGTGKTFLAVGFALNEFLRGNYNKILFTRPCIEAYGESLGFLPGGFNDKISPYMIPIFDVLELFLEKKSISALLEEKRIVTLPLAYHRGITFNDTFVVVDECQNTVPQQVRMLLTRLGHNSKIAVTGDPSQTDRSGVNGLEDAIERLKGVTDIGMVYLSHSSIVRHSLVSKVDKKYSSL